MSNADLLDKYGHTYKELLAIQTEHLALWKKLLRPEIHRELEREVLAANSPAESTAVKHNVPRGQDLIELIRTWPSWVPAKGEDLL